VYRGYNAARVASGKEKERERAELLPRSATHSRRGSSSSARSVKHDKEISTPAKRSLLRDGPHGRRGSESSVVEAATHGGVHDASHARANGHGHGHKGKGEAFGKKVEQGVEGIKDGLEGMRDELRKARPPGVKDTSAVEEENVPIVSLCMGATRLDGSCQDRLVGG
jgi:hypothetical protein